MRPPAQFPEKIIFQIKSGSTLNDIARELKTEHLIRSSSLFQFLVILFADENKIVSGDYLFDAKIPLNKVADRVINGKYGIAPVKITIPEGFNIIEIADVYYSNLRDFNKDAFLELVKEKEGYLFPDTYLFFPNTTHDVVIEKMSENFNNKINPLMEKIEQSGKTLAQIITMASIIEKESTDGDRNAISGILWKRIKRNMPLQVDASFIYLLGKGSSELTMEDLNFNSPYNTYRNLGLPPGPIGNPGLASILAALEPEESPYFYYLHDKDGIIHYAKTFEEHKVNKQRYLK